MMINEYQKFMNILRYVIGYAVDRLPSEVADDTQRRYFNLSHKTFFEELYVQRNVEHFIEEQIDIAPDLLCFVGPRGSGKSSIGLKFNYLFEKAKPVYNFLTFIDIRLQAELKSFKFDSSKELEESIRQIVIASYLDNIFKISKTDYINRLKLYEFIICDRKDFIKPKELFWVFHIVKDKATKLYIKYTHAIAKRNKISCFNWLEEEFISNNELSLLCNEIEVNLDIAHLVYAARTLFGFTRQILWIDNVDRLPEAIQPDFVNFLRNCLNQISGYMTVILSLREENVNRDFDQTEEETPPYPIQIFLENPREMYKACDLPIVKNAVLNEIVKKRVSFTKKYQKDIYEKLKNKIDKKALTDFEKIDNKQAKKEIGFFGPPISDTCFEYLRKLSDIVFDVSIKERAILIANNSIRSFLFGYFHFLEYLLNIPPIENESFNKYPATLRYYEREGQWFISTLFFFFIRHSVDEDRLGFYDIIEITDKYYKDLLNIGCCLPYLIITSIWNLTLEKRNNKKNIYKNPTVSDVIKRLELLGYKRGEILNAIYDLYNVQGTRSNIIEFRLRHTIKNIKEIKDDYLIYVTYRGKCFVSLTGNSLGYIYESIRYLEKKEMAITNPHIAKTLEYAEKTIPYLCKIAKMNCETFRNIRDKGHLNKKNILNDYLAKFGIPFREPYVYNPSYGDQINGIRRVLHLEAIINRILFYVNVAPSKEKLENLLRLYRNKIESIANNKDNNEIIEFENEIL